MPEKTFDINISRVRRAIDYWDELTGGERLVAGVIADHFNPEEGYAFPSYRYLEFVYGFSQATISSTVRKLRKGLMTIDRSGGNNQYIPDMPKVESVLARLEAKRAGWKDRKPKHGASRGEAGASRDEAEVLRKVKPNVQRNAQPKDQYIPNEDSLGVSARSSQTERAYGADRHGNDNRPAYKQTKAQADEVLTEIKRIWPQSSEDAEHQPGTDSAKAEAIHWYKLLKSGIAASRIQRAALHYLSDVLDGQWPCSFVSFLTGRLPDYLDPEQPDLFIPEDALTAAERSRRANDDQAPAPRANDNVKLDRASGDGSSYGGECGPDDPF